VAALTVADVMKQLEAFPKDMPVFRISDYWCTCDSAEEKECFSIEHVAEIEFADGRKAFHCGDLSGLRPHTIIREFDVLNLG
jgi:hypothetical protein